MGDSGIGLRSGERPLLNDRSLSHWPGRRPEPDAYDRTAHSPKRPFVCYARGMTTRQPGATREKKAAPHAPVRRPDAAALFHRLAREQAEVLEALRQFDRDHGQ